jgi:hypothetical protein
MWPSWATVALTHAAVALVVGVPTVFIDDSSSRVGYIVAASAVATVSTTVAYATLVLSQYDAVTTALLKAHRSLIDDFDISPLSEDPTVEAERWDAGNAIKEGIQASLEADCAAHAGLPAATSRQPDIFRLQCGSRDLIRAAKGQQAVRRRLAALLLHAQRHEALLPPAAAEEGPAVVPRNDSFTCASRISDADSDDGGRSERRGDSRRVDEVSVEISPRSGLLQTSPGGREPRITPSAPLTRSLKDRHVPVVVRGQRFLHDDVDVAMYIQRNKNGNLVVYRACTTAFRSERVLVPDAPIDAFWYDIDEATMASTRRKGKADDRSELNAVERKFAYGISCTADEARDVRHRCFKVTFVALPGLEFELSMIDAADAHGDVRRVAVMTTAIDGHPSIAERIWVQASETSWLPRVDFVDIFGQRLADGLPVQQRFTKT